MKLCGKMTRFGCASWPLQIVTLRTYRESHSLLVRVLGIGQECGHGGSPDVHMCQSCCFGADLNIILATSSSCLPKGHKLSWCDQQRRIAALVFRVRAPGRRPHAIEDVAGNPDTLGTFDIFSCLTPHQLPSVETISPKLPHLSATELPDSRRARGFSRFLRCGQSRLAPSPILALTLSRDACSWIDLTRPDPP
jgi:hypothetical protein